MWNNPFFLFSVAFAKNFFEKAFVVRSTQKRFLCGLS